MQLRTYTGLWNNEKRIYRFYDLNLPMPITVRQLVTGILFGIPWCVLMAKLQVSLESPWYLFYIVPPGFAFWQANRPIAEGKSFLPYLQSQIMYLIGPRKYGALQPIEGKVAAKPVTGKAWRHRSI